MTGAEHSLHPARDDLSAYLDGELAQPELVSVGEHLRSCGDCRAVIDELAAVTSALAQIDAVPPSDAERDGWRNAVGVALAAQTLPVYTAGEPPKVVSLGAARRRRVPMPALAAAAAALLFLTGIITVLTTRRGNDSAPVAAGEPTTGQPVAPRPQFTAQTVAEGRNCAPAARPEPTPIEGAGAAHEVVARAVRDCPGPLTRADAGSLQREYTQGLDARIPGIDKCVTPIYDQYAGPLLPVYAQPTQFSGVTSFIVVFYTSTIAGTAPDDPLDIRQAWVLSSSDCQILNVTAS